MHAKQPPTLHKAKINMARRMSFDVVTSTGTFFPSMGIYSIIKLLVGRLQEVPSVSLTCPWSHQSNKNLNVYCIRDNKVIKNLNALKLCLMRCNTIHVVSPYSSFLWSTVNELRRLWVCKILCDFTFFRLLATARAWLLSFLTILLFFRITSFATIFFSTVRTRPLSPTMLFSVRFWSVMKAVLFRT